MDKGTEISFVKFVHSSSFLLLLLLFFKVFHSKTIRIVS